MAGTPGLEQTGRLQMVGRAVECKCLEQGEFRTQDSTNALAAGALQWYYAPDYQ